jgi:hypothetical protein
LDTYDKRNIINLFLPSDSNESTITVLIHYLNILGIGGIFGLSKLYFSFRPKAIDFFKKYSKTPSFKELLGLQAEIQSELKILLKTWVREKDLQSNKRRILLLVDDIDRCSEERLMQLIDSLRVMLEEDGIYQRVVVIIAVDERFLKRAVRWKYRYMINEPRDNDDSAIDRLAKEYMDKLFLSGIKLGNLTEDERKEVFSAYTGHINGSRGGLFYSEEKESTIGDSRNELEKEDIFPRNITQEIDEEATTNYENKSNFHLDESEYNFLLANLSLLGDTTPRQLRILYYRYLLSRNLVNLILNTDEFRNRDYISLLPYILINIVNEQYGNSNKEYKIIEDIRKKEPEIEEQTLLKLLNIIKMVVAY